ncbi:MAG: SH3 domain-containing protein [Anaerolineales bacterium]|nr:SH3 domain-containing protein [Anaerolineales bacterium]
MKLIRTLSLSLLLPLLVACQAATDLTSTLDPSSTVDDSPADEDLTLSTESLQQALSEAGADVVLEGNIDQPFFSAPGQIIAVNGESVQVFEYTDPALTDADAGQVSSDGSSIGTMMATWEGPPHFFRADQLIVLYVGEDPGVIELLEAILGSQFAGAGPSQGPSLDTEPSPAFLMIDDQQQSSGIGSYCWPDDTTGMALCLDKVGLPTAHDPLQVNGPFLAQLSIPLPNPPDILSLTTIPVIFEAQMEVDAEGMRWWPPNPGDPYDLPLAPPHQLELNLEPGIYVLSVFAQWQDFGDVLYGFLIEVLPAEGAETSPGEADVTFVQVLAEAGLNLRTAPGIDSEVVRVLRQNEIVPVTGQSPDGAWWQIACSGSESGECWISADPTLSAPTNLAEISLAGLIYAHFDQQPERPLWQIGADGKPVKFLESSQNLGALSPDAKRAVSGPLSRGETNLTLVNLASGERIQLTDTPDRMNFNPQWWPTNLDTIVFISHTFNPNDQPRPGPGNLTMVKADGTGFQLLDADNLTHTLFPALSPDGQTIAYDRGGENASEDGILTPWLYHLENGPTPFDYTAYGLTPVPDLSFGRAAWSPDGRYLAWVVGGELTGDGEWQIGIAMFDLETQSVELFNPYAPTSGPFVAGWEPPIWSPDSEWLAWYVSPQGGLPGFWVMHPNGTDKQLIDHAGSPIWSPDGDLLVYLQLANGAIMAMEAGQWQPQRTDLPSQIGFVTWINLNE